MTVEQSKVEEAFAAVLAAREGDSRAALNTREVLGLCGGDPDVHREVQSLLSHLDAAGATSSDSTVFLDPGELHGSRGPAPALGDDSLLRDWGGEAVGQRIDHFTIIGKLGEGGMGVVYVAQQHNPRRTVALKLMRRGLATTASRRRFEREAQILGQLNHPGVAQIYAAGIAEILAGNSVVQTPYIAMELVDGPTIEQYACDRRRDLKLIFSLLAQACDAVQHAHLRGIIHRDLKPANILVSEGASQPTVKVLDFGVARPLSDTSEFAAMTQITADGHLVGTLAYMAPEQLNSKQPVDTRADVYSLGVVLYHLLTGRFPIELNDCGIADGARRIAEQEPAPLSMRSGEFDRDLETILEKALRKDPDRRYQSPGELARDLRLYQAGEPIEAKRDSLLYVMGKRAKRYRVMLTAALLAVLALAFVATYARHQEHKAQAARGEADRAAIQLADELSASRIEQARLIGASGDMLSAENMLWREALAHPDSPHVHWALWELYSHFPCVRSIRAHKNAIYCAVWSPDGSMLCSGGDDGTINLFDAASGALIRSMHSPSARNWSVEFSPDGKRLFSTGDEVSETIWDVATGNEIARLAGRTGSAYRGAWSRDGRLIFSTGADGTVRIWDAQSYAPLAVLPVLDDKGRPIESHAVALDSQGKHLIAGCQSGILRGWKLRYDEHDHLICEPDGISFGPAIDALILCDTLSPDGALLAVGCADRTTRLYNANTGERLASLRAANGTNRYVAFSPDGTQLAIAGYWRVDLWNVATRERYRPGGIESIVADGAFSARYSLDGSTIATSASNGLLRLWNIASDGGQQIIAKHGGAVRAVVVARDADRILVGSIAADSSISVTSASAGGSEGRPDKLEWKRVLHAITPSMPRAAVFAPDASALLVGCDDGMIRTYNVASGAPVEAHACGHDGPVISLAWNGDRSALISGGSDGTVRIRPAGSTDPTSIRILGKDLGEVLGIDCSPDGRLLAVNGRAVRTQLLSLPDGKPVAGWPKQTFSIWTPSFSPDGRWLSGGSWDRSVVVWDARDPARPPVLVHGHSQIVGQVAFDDAGKIMASCSNDGTVKLWDVTPVPAKPAELVPEGQRHLATLNAAVGDAFSIRFLPAPLNDHLVVAYVDGTVRTWDLKTFEPHIRAAEQFRRTQASTSN